MRKLLIAGGVVVLAVLCLISEDLVSHFLGGTSLGGARLGPDRAIEIVNGYKRGAVTWLAIADWDLEASREERLADDRIKLVGAEYRVKTADGRMISPNLGTAYLYRGARLTTIGIAMQESDLIPLDTGLASMDAVEAYLRGFSPVAPR